MLFVRCVCIWQIVWNTFISVLYSSLVLPVKSHIEPLPEMLVINMWTVYSKHGIYPWMVNVESVQNSGKDHIPLLQKTNFVVQFWSAFKLSLPGFQSWWGNIFFSLVGLARSSMGGICYITMREFNYWQPPEDPVLSATGWWGRHTSRLNCTGNKGMEYILVLRLNSMELRMKLVQ